MKLSAAFPLHSTLAAVFLGMVCSLPAQEFSASWEFDDGLVVTNATPIDGVEVSDLTDLGPTINGAMALRDGGLALERSADLGDGSTAWGGRREGAEQPNFLSFTVRNTGQKAVEIHSLGMTLKGGALLAFQLLDADGRELTAMTGVPGSGAELVVSADELTTIAPGESADFLIDFNSSATTSRHSIDAIRIYGFVGSGVEPVSDKPNVIVIFTDDQGYADLGAQGILDDIKTPNLDRLAARGVRFTNGYITAPQCSPSRAGLLTGRYQQRFGFDSISDGPLPTEEVTIAERLRDAGYATGMVGKWHLEANPATVRWMQKRLPGAKMEANGMIGVPLAVQKEGFPVHHGFDQFYKGEMARYWANYGIDGEKRNRRGEWVNHTEFRIDTQTSAATAFIDQNRDQSFFLYVAYFAPHVPLEATQKYLDRFPGEMPERRRYALAMISAVDDGVGAIMDRLEENGLSDKTLIVFMSDNGAPLKIDKEDLPISFPGGAWDGSLNDPLTGEKGMLAEGGIRVPFLMSWPGTIPEGEVFDDPVSSLDVAATANAMAGLTADPVFDGVDLIPFLAGNVTGPPHEDLYWKFWNQAAIRSGDWKYLQAGGGIRMLFNLADDPEERVNVIEDHADVAGELEASLTAWASEVRPTGLPKGGLNDQEQGWYRHYFGEPTEP